MHRVFLGLGLLFNVSLLDIGPAWAADKTAEAAPAAVIAELSPRIETLNRTDLMRLGRAYSQDQNPTSAIKVFTAVLAKNAKDVEAKTLIGAEQLKLANTKEKEREALETLKGAIETNPKYLPAYRELIKYYEKRQNKYELRLIYQDLVDRLGPQSEFVTQLCKYTTLEGLYDLSEKYCKQGMELAPKEASNFVYRGLALKDIGQTEESEKILKTAATKFLKSELAQSTYAQVQSEKKNYIEAYSYFKRAVKADAESVPALLGLAQSALEIQKMDESFDAFQRACKRDRSIVPYVRRARTALRTLKKTEWDKKFEQLSESCGN